MVLKDSPSYHRNIDVLVETLRKIFPDSTGNVLEIGSGSGQHITRFAKEFPKLNFQPSDLEVENIVSIDGWNSELNCTNVKPACVLDVHVPSWFHQGLKFDFLLCFNVIHIAPWQVTIDLFKGARRHLRRGAKLILYGPFKIDHQHTSASNQEFEKWLHAKDARFGVRDISDVVEIAATTDFRLWKRIEMPANNFLLVFELLE